MNAAETEIDPAAMAHCLAETRRHDRERYLTAMASPAPARPRLLALYAFNLELSRVAEAVSEPMLGLIRLQWWRDCVRERATGAKAPNAVAAALAGALNAGAIGEKPLLALIDGRERDLDKAPFENLPALQTYLSQTSGALLRAAAAMMGAPDESAALRSLGLSYGLAGIIRAVPHHGRHGRVCLPLDLLRRHGLSVEDVLARRAREKVRAAAAELASTAEDALRAAAGASAMAVGLPALLHGELAKGHLRAIGKSGYDPYDPLPAGAGFSAFRLQWRAWRGRM